MPSWPISAETSRTPDNVLYTALERIAHRHSSRVAMRHNGREVSFAELWQKSDEQAKQLRLLGVAAGDRVAILAENGIDAVVAMWAIFKCRAISVYLNEQLKPSGLKQIIHDSDPVLLLCHPASMQDKLPKGLPCRVLELTQLATAVGQGSRAAETGLARAGQCTAVAEANAGGVIASIIYTSGSTGTPKGVCLTHENLLSVAAMAADGYRTTADDSYLMVVPLHYIHGLMILMALQLRGACIEFMNSFMFPALVTRKLQDSDVTGFSGVPYHFAALIDRGGFLQAELPSLRWIGVTGGTITPERLQQIRQARPELEIHISYGQTECSPRITLLHPDKIDIKPTSVGAAAEGLTVEFLDDNNMPVAAGEIGELVVAGPNVMHGYWNDPDNTDRVVDKQGRLHTGDLAYIDSDGDIFIKGRKQAMIKSAGERIFPEEIEALLNTHASVADVAVVGVADPIYGQRVEAHIVLKNSATDELTTDHQLQAVKKYCLEHVPFARAPRRYHKWSEFPLKANGKTDKQKLIADTDSSSDS